MKRLTVLICVVVLCMITTAVASGGAGLSATAFAAPSQTGNSSAAHMCHDGGYGNLMGADGTLFGNVGACVSYAGNGGVLLPLPTCTATDSTGCAILRRASISAYDWDAQTAVPGAVTLTGAISFDSTCQGDCLRGHSLSGGGSGIYSVSGSNASRGTFVVTSIFGTQFFDPFWNPAPCAAAPYRVVAANVTLTSSTGATTTAVVGLTMNNGVEGMTNSSMLLNSVVDGQVQYVGDQFFSVVDGSATYPGVSFSC